MTYIKQSASYVTIIFLKIFTSVTDQFQVNQIYKDKSRIFQHKSRISFTLPKNNK